MCAGWEIDLARRELRSRGIPVRLGSRAFEILEVLVQSVGELVNKHDLMGRVWPGAIVEENTVQFHISAIRKALGPDGAMLKTASGRGYRLLGTWTIQQESRPTDPVDLEPGPTPVQPFQTNVSVAASALIGRSAVVQHLRNLLSAHRVVTLTGPGGIGKTVLGLEVARDLFPTFQGDVCLVELVSLADPGLVPSAIVGVLGLKLGGDEISCEAVARAVRGRKLLLVLDNCEHVIDAAAKLAEVMVRMCPSVSILATSREVMRIEGEYVYRVPPLDVPLLHQEDPGTLLGQSAVRLFIARTSALNSDFSPDADNLPAIAAICRRLDGNPLAIEFAAARAATLGVKQVASHLDDRFGLLTGGHRTALPRHQTLHAVLDWSYDLLSETERGLLRRLAIFPAGFTLEAVTAVMSDAAGSISAVVDGISNLVSKSLVVLDESGPADRWRLLETIRAYALEKLAESGEAGQAARCHAKFFRDFIASVVPRSPPIEEMFRCGREIDNVRAALDWSFSPAGDSAIGIALTAAYAQVWIKFELMVECRNRVERALARIDSDVSLSAPLRMQLHLALGGALIFTMGSVGAAETALIKALEIAKSLEDLDAQVRALRTLSGLHFYRGECRAAESTAKQLSIIARRTCDPAVELIADRLLGNALQYAGSQSEARRCFEHVIERYVAPEHYRHSLWLQHDDLVLARALLARTLWLQGYVDRAADQAKTSLEEAQATRHNISVCRVLYYAVFPIALAIGDVAGAERAAAMSMEYATTSNSAYWSVMARYLEGKLLIARSNFGEGTVVLRTALDACEKTGWTRSSPDVLGTLAQGLSGLGQVTEALATADKAISTADRGGERWCVAELLRIKGELLLHEKNDRSIAAVEDCFQSALDVAREQGALFWELRTATSVARLRAGQNRHDEAQQVLASVYDRFTEGFETADLSCARVTLGLSRSDQAVSQVSPLDENVPG